VRDGIFVDPLARAGAGLFGIVVILVHMWGLKEKASELVQRVKDYFDAPRIFSTLFISFILSLFIIFKYYYSYPFQIDDESAMYFLSALVQSQAAILAIVITLTLIAVQLASSHYSPRVIDVFKRDPAIWWFLCYYGISIFFGLYILIMMQVIQNGNIVIPIGLNRYSFHISLEYWIYAVYLIAIGNFVVLFWYMRTVFDLLKPSNIIKKLSDNITKEKISKHIKSLEEHKKYRTKPIEDDPVQPIVDIIHGSVMRYDIATTSIGINAIADRAIDVMDSYSFSISAEFKNELDPGSISKEFKNEFKKTGHPLVGSLTVEKIDIITGKKWRIHDESGRELYRVIMDKNEELTGLIDLGTEIKVSEHFFRHFKEIIRLTAKADETPTIYVIKNLESLGMLTAEKKLEYATKGVLHSLIGWIGIIIERRFGDVTIDTINALLSIGTVAAENKLEDAVFHAVKYLDRVGRDAEENGTTNVVWAVFEYIGQLGRTAVENELCHATKEAIGALVHFGKSEIEKKQKGRAERVLLLLERIGTVTVETREELEPVTRQASELEGVVKRLVLSLIELGSSAVENGDDSTAYESARILTELTISSEEVVRDEIDKISKYTPNYDSFQKFVQMYKLEKLRVKKSE